MPNLSAVLRRFGSFVLWLDQCFLSQMSWWFSTTYTYYIDGLVQKCSISITNTLERLQSFTKPWIKSHVLMMWLCFSKIFTKLPTPIQHSEMIENANILLTILCMRPVDEGQRFITTSSLIGWAHTQNDHWHIFMFRQINQPIQNYISQWIPARFGCTAFF